jgi:hypothetical protein
MNRLKPALDRARFRPNPREKFVCVRLKLMRLLMVSGDDADNPGKVRLIQVHDSSTIGELGEPANALRVSRK